MANAGRQQIKTAWFLLHARMERFRHMLGVSTDTEHLWEKTHLLQVLCAVSVAGVLSREPVLEEDQLLIHAFALINTASL